MALSYIITFLTACVISGFLTWVVRNAAIERNWVSTPASARHVHTRPIPRLGGIAILVTFVLVVGLAYLMGTVIDKDGGVNFKKIGLLLLPSLLVFVVGLYDDFRGVKPWVKFAAQALGGVMLFAFGFRVSSLKLFFGNDPLDTAAALALTVFWVMLVTNAFNLIDGLDGLAAGSGLFSIMVMFVLSLFTRSHTETFAAIALAGAVVGFLRYNFNPASIFLGDCGSLFIGFMLASISLAGSYKTPTLVAVTIPLVAFGLPITDTALSVTRRFMSGKPLFSADREHIHHKLLERGLSHRQSAIVLYGVSASFGLASIFLLYPRGSTVALVLIVVSVLMFVGIGKLGYHEFTEIERIATRTMEQRQIIINNLALRRAMQQLRMVESTDQVIATLEQAFKNNDFDGFDLRLMHEFGDAAIMERVPEGLQYIWTKSGDDAPSNAWDMHLPIFSKGREIGKLTVFRHYNGSALKVDINLLIGEFARAMSVAVEAASVRRTMVAPITAGAGLALLSPEIRNN